jgi:flagellar biosynthesis/type III secretory pathway protein FliH
MFGYEELKKEFEQEIKEAIEGVLDEGFDSTYKRRHESGYTEGFTDGYKSEQLKIFSRLISEGVMTIDQLTAMFDLPYEMQKQLNEIKVA